MNRATNKQAAPNPAARTPSNRSQRQQATAHRSSVQQDGVKAKQTYNYHSTVCTPPPQHQHHQSSTLPIINAPKSLANLAQLSGITLLPLGNGNQPQSRITTNHIINTTKFPSNIPTSHLDSSPPGASIHAKSMTAIPVQGNRQHVVNHVGRSSLTASVPPPTTAAELKRNATNNQPIYNIHALPTSFHAINQATSTESTIHYSDPMQSWMTPTTANSADSKSQFKIHSQSKTAKKFANTNRSNNSNRIATKPQINYHHQSNNDVQVTPKTSDGLQMFADLSDIQPAQSGSSFEDIFSQPSLESSANEQYATDTNGELNNLSLIKLMAILNNPALTITAVNADRNANKLQCSSVDDYVAMSVNNLVESQQKLAVSRSKANNQLKSDSARSCSDRGQASQIDRNALKNRIPQSAANLQMIHGENLNRSSSGSRRDLIYGTASSSRDIDSIDASQVTCNLSTMKNHQEQSDLKSNWLSNYNLTNHNLTNSTGNINVLDDSTLSQSGSNNAEANDKSPFMIQDKLDSTTILSTSVRNLIMQQAPSNGAGTRNQHTASVQLLKHIANQTKDNNDWTVSDKSILEPECILSIHRFIKQPNRPAKKVESSKVVQCNTPRKKYPKRPLQTSEKRLYIPSPESLANKRKKSVSEPVYDLNRIEVIDSDLKSEYVSERHCMLDSMLSDENQEQSKISISEPDDIFINRSKRVMSLIDTMVERKKRKRFERISGRQEPKADVSLEELCAYSEDEWSCDEDLDYTGFIRTQLPLEEIETEEKKNHLLSVGLLSRNEKNKVMIERCEERLKIFSPLHTSQEVSDDVVAFVDTVLKTGGTDIQLRIDTNIKRNDLPLLEGLTRTTSRIKMYYMNTLGLEKRSKRTTLYKVKSSDNTIASPSKSIDLNKIKLPIMEKPQKVVDPVIEEPKQMTLNHLIDANIVLPTKFNYTTCREAMKRAPSKSEYMKSLGLIAS